MHSETTEWCRPQKQLGHTEERLDALALRKQVCPSTAGTIPEYIGNFVILKIAHIRFDSEFNILRCPTPDISQNKIDGLGSVRVSYEISNNLGFGT